MIIGQRLLDLRLKNNMTQKELADAIGVEISAINRYEHEKGDMNTENLRRLANVFGVTSDYLLGISIDDQPSERGVTPNEMALLEMIRNGKRLEAIRYITNIEDSENTT